MIKVNITKSIENCFEKLVLDIFKNGKLIKKEKGKDKFDISIQNLDNLIQKKLKGFDKTITLNKLIVADVDYLYGLISFIDENKECTLQENEKDYFYTLYKRLKKSEYVKLLKVSTCLYCNRNYILNFKKNNILNAKAK